MRKIYLTAAAALLGFMPFSGAKAQTYNLSVPSYYSSVSFTPAAGSSNFAPEPGRVYYGAVPYNSSTKPVLVFIHGYTSQASTWFVDNDMYLKAYNAGYRTAFVSVHPDKSMWINGQMFSGMLNQITARFGVAKVVVVAHSKGGVDTDAALIHYGGFPKVDRVVTLGTPHYGTALADLAQSGWVWWLSAIFGQANDATYVLQRGYMNYYRSVTDGHVNNPKTNFRTLGAWGYSGIMLMSGWYLNVNGGGSDTGGNDGVVPYYSSKRPGGAVLLGGYGDWRSEMNHSEVAKGSYTWTYIAPQLPASPLATNANIEVAKAVNPNAVTVSKSQVISSDKGDRTFIIEPNASKVHVEIRQADAGHEYSISAPNGAPVQVRKTEAARVEDGLGHVSTSFELNSPQAGAYSIRSEKPFVAIITSEEGVAVKLSSDLNDEKYVYASGETMNYKVQLEGATEDAKVTGMLIRTGSLDGAARANEAVPMAFAKNANGEYTYSVKRNLEPGVYNISINAEGKGFRKTIISSVAVVADQRKGFIDNGAAGELAMLNVYPNPSNGDAALNIEIREQGNARLKVYDMMGRIVKDFDLSAYSAGQHTINWTADADLQNGAYLCELSNGKERVTKVMMLVR